MKWIFFSRKVLPAEALVEKISADAPVVLDPLDIAISSDSTAETVVLENSTSAKRAAEKLAYNAEFTQLLRSRVFLLTGTMFAILTSSFILDLLWSQFMFGFSRMIFWLVLLLFIIIQLIFRQLSARILRWIEIIVLITINAYLSLMMIWWMSFFALQCDDVSCLTAWKSYEGAWIVVILVAAILMPNSWQRTLCICAPMSILPDIIVWWHCSQNEIIAGWMRNVHLSLLLPHTEVAAAVAVFNAYMVSRLRRTAFHAKIYGQYNLKKQIGTGGCGVVYLAEHRLLRRPCALKIMRPDKTHSVEMLDRFESEVKQSARLSHWNSIEIYDYGRTDDGEFFYVMELLHGKDLAQMVQTHGVLPPARIIYLMRQACSALHEAHSMGLVHRDIKPENIVAAIVGGCHDVTKILDFGLVEDQFLHDAAANSSGTQSAVFTLEQQQSNEIEIADISGVFAKTPPSGMSSREKNWSFIGSPYFMSPEQMTPYHLIDYRVDIYALGATCYYLLTGCPPLLSKRLRNQIELVQKQMPRLPSDRVRGVPQDLEQVIMKCLQKSPSHRFASAAELREALDACAAADGWNEKKAAEWWRRVPDTAWKDSQ